MPRRRGNPSGFTLLEIMVVMVIMGLVLSLVLAHGPMRSTSLSLRGAAGEIVQSLRAARGQAIATDAVVPFVFDATRHSFGAPGHMQALPAGMNMTVTAPSAAGIWFAPDGSASGGGIVLAAGKLSVGLTVSWLTGRVGLSGAASGD